MKQLQATGTTDHSCISLLQYDPQATGVIDYQALMKQLLHSDYYALYLGTVDNTQNTLDATSTFNMITSLKTQFAAQSQKLKQVGLLYDFFIVLVLFQLHICYSISMLLIQFMLDRFKRLTLVCIVAIKCKLRNH